MALVKQVEENHFRTSFCISEVLALKPLSLLPQQNQAKKKEKQGESLKTIQILVPGRRPNLIANSIILSAWDTFCPGQNILIYLVLDGPCISEVAHSNIPQDTPGPRNQNIQRSTLGERVEGLELRAIRPESFS